MKTIILILIIGSFFSCTSNNKAAIENYTDKNGFFYDPINKWDTTFSFKDTLFKISITRDSIPSLVKISYFYSGDTNFNLYHDNNLIIDIYINKTQTLQKLIVKQDFIQHFKKPFYNLAVLTNGKFEKYELGNFFFILTFAKPDSDWIKEIKLKIDKSGNQEAKLVYESD